MTWYALSTKPQAEMRALLRLLATDYAAYLPLAYVERRHGRRIETLTVALYGRYVFLNLADGQGLEAALSLGEISDVVRHDGGIPWVIPDDAMASVFYAALDCGGIRDLRPLTQSEHQADDRHLWCKIGGPDADEPRARAWRIAS